jgi:hypothetical protein
MGSLSHRLWLAATILKIYRLPLCTGKGEVTTAAVHHRRKVFEITGLGWSGELAPELSDCLPRSAPQTLDFYLVFSSA